jgi:hypothetical protein
MISFKVKPENHVAISRWSKRFFMVVFIAGAALLSFMGIDSYRQANSILGDHGTVTVPVELVDVTEERGRKGRTRTMYHFGYAFEAGGERHEGHFSTSESNADPYLVEGATIEVAYANADPSRFDRLSRLESQSGFGSLIVRILVALAGAALVAFVLHMLVVGKLIVPREPEPAVAG